jgi:hypothetical protein
VLRVDPNGNSASLVEAVANDKYFEFSLAPLPDAALNLAGLEFDNFELVGIAVPEPATVGLALSALLGLAVWRRRRSMAA